MTEPIRPHQVAGLHFAIHSFHQRVAALDITEELKADLLEQIEDLKQVGLDILNDAMHDDLTGLPRRPMFEVQREQIISMQERGIIKSLSLAVLDIDHFKSINDTYGHDVGDEVLKIFGQELLRLKHNQLRISDLLCRWGGEEFLILMVGSIGDELNRRVENLRRAVGEAVTTSLAAAYPDLKVTVSAGLAEMVADGGWDELFKLADKALYRAKSEGRDRLVVFGRTI
jgi:two-component system cell cycle response regulator